MNRIYKLFWKYFNCEKRDYHYFEYLFEKITEIEHTFGNDKWKRCHICGQLVSPNHKRVRILIKEID